MSKSAQTELISGHHSVPLHDHSENSDGEVENGNHRHRSDDDRDDHHADHESSSLVYSLTGRSNDSLSQGGRQQQQQQQRWRRLPVTEDDYLEDADDDELNSDFEPVPTGLVSKRFLLLGIAIFLIALLSLLIPKSNKQDDNHIDPSEPYTTKKIKGTPQYSCPHILDINVSSTFIGTDENYDPVMTTKLEEIAINVSSNLDWYIESFRDIKYDQWEGKSYKDIKEDIRQWKKSKFLTHLKTGSSIYDTGSGIGLNLLLTLEILQEEKDTKYITDLHLYGNDYVTKSAQVGNVLLDKLLSSTNKAFSNNAKRGVICAADSTTLHQFVPADSFDLVYSSFVPPLHDPLSLETIWKNDTMSLNQQRMDELCHVQNGVNDDWKAKTLIQLAQARQNAWYNSWVIEMVRMAKPGVPIIFEYVSPEYCFLETPLSTKNQSVHTIKYSSSTAGVSKDFWKDAITKYNWDIIEDSLEIESDLLFPSRYHVFMMKKGP